MLQKKGEWGVRIKVYGVAKKRGVGCKDQSISPVVNGGRMMYTYVTTGGEEAYSGSVNRYFMRTSAI